MLGLRMPWSAVVVAGAALAGGAAADDLPPGAVARLGFPALFHTRDVFDVTYSPDGKILACGSDDAMIRLWDATTGKLLRQWRGNKKFVCGLAFAPDGKVLASGGDDPVVHLWDPDSGREFKSLKGHTGLVSAVAFAPGRQDPGLGKPRPDGSIVGPRDRGGAAHLSQTWRHCPIRLLFPGRKDAGEQCRKQRSHGTAVGCCFRTSPRLPWGDTTVQSTRRPLPQTARPWPLPATTQQSSGTWRPANGACGSRRGRSGRWRSPPMARRWPPGVRATRTSPGRRLPRAGYGMWQPGNPFGPSRAAAPSSEPWRSARWPHARRRRRSFGALWDVTHGPAPAGPPGALATHLHPGLEPRRQDPGLGQRTGDGPVLEGYR